YENGLTLWDTTGCQPGIPRQGHEGLVVSLAFAPGGAGLASGGLDNTIWLWGVGTGRAPRVLRGDSHPGGGGAVFPAGTTLSSAPLRGNVKLWKVAAGVERATLAVCGEEATAVAFSPDGRILAVAVEQAVQLWDVGTASWLTGLAGHEGKVNCLAYSPD